MQVLKKTAFSDMKQRMGRRLTEDTDTANKKAAEEEKPKEKPGFYRKGIIKSNMHM